MLVALVALAFAIPAQTADSAELVGRVQVRTVGPDLDALIVSGLDRSPTFRELINRLGRTDWLVFVVRGRCPEPEIVACLWHRVGTFEGKPFLRIVLDNRQLRSSRLEISSLAHEFQHALEAAESDDVVDTASLSARFRQIGYVSLRTPTATAFETEAARQVGMSVQRELDHGSSRKRPDLAGVRHGVMTSPLAGRGYSVQGEAK